MTYSDSAGHTPSGRLANWAGNLVFGARAVHRPESLDELRRAVRDAARIRALGTGHSFSDVADTDAELVVLDRMPRGVRIDAEARTATVPAGARYAEIAPELERAGFALANLASLPHISVAGACATGTHGSGDAQPSLAAAVTALELVGPEGDLLRLDRDADPARFPGAVVGLGALGVATEVTLRLERTFALAQYVYLGLPLARLEDSFDEVFSSAYSVSVFTDWGSDRGRVWRKQRTEQAAPPRAWLDAVLAEEPQHPVPGAPLFHLTPQLGVPGPWFERLPHFRPEFTPSSGEELQSEFLVAREAAPQAAAALRGLGDRLAPVLHISEVRTVAGDDLWLSPAYGRASTAFHFTWLPDLAAVAPVLAEVEAALRPLGARPHWGKLSAGRAGARFRAYPRAADFRRLRQELDPAGKFGNAFTDAQEG